MKHTRLLVVLCLSVISFGAFAQNHSAMRINEILVTNTNDFQDDFGQQNAWIELFNSSYGTVDVGGCFLSDDAADLRKYSIPKGDVLTKVKPRQHLLFWADNQPFRGTFHTNFTLIPGKTIFFVASDGKTIIDQIVVPQQFADSSMTNVSYGRTDDGIGSTDGKGEGWKVMAKTSPSTNNAEMAKVSKSQRMGEIDPYGWMLAVTSMSVVFIALIILYRLFKRIAQISNRKADKKTQASVNPQTIKTTKAEENSSETFAAIAMALHLYQEENEAHDEESFVVTLQHTDRSYSPWSSKIYSLRENPQVNRRK